MDDTRGWDRNDHIGLVEMMEDLDDARLTTWEIDFIESCRSQLLEPGSELTEKQVEKCEDIIRRCKDD